MPPAEGKEAPAKEEDLPCPNKVRRRIGPGQAHQGAGSVSRLRAGVSGGGDGGREPALACPLHN